MKKIRFAFLISIGLLLIQAPVLAEPIPVDFAPAAQTVDLGEQVTVDVVITPGSDLIGTFDLSVLWDSTLMTLADVVFGSALGDALFFETLEGFFDYGGGVVDVFQLSFLPADVRRSGHWHRPQHQS